MNAHWEMLSPDMTMEHLGIIPYWLTANDHHPAKEQLDDNYQHGGGWRHINGFALSDDNSLQYGPDDDEDRDPPLVPRAVCQLREETIVFYDYSWVAIIQPDRSFEVCRMD